MYDCLCIVHIVSLVHIELHHCFSIYGIYNTFDFKNSENQFIIDIFHSFALKRQSIYGSFFVLKYVIFVVIIMT